MDDRMMAEAVLKHYRQAELLNKHPALRWPSVQARHARTATAVEALRQLFDHACATVAQRYPFEIALLRARFIEGQTLDDVLVHFNISDSKFFRIRNTMLDELTLVIAAENLRARRTARYRRFLALPSPVFGVTDALQLLVAKLRDPHGPSLYLLEGMGGLGKTTLARLIAQHFADDQHFEGLLWVSAQQVIFDHWSASQRPAEQAAATVADMIRGLARQLEIDLPGDLAMLLEEVRIACQQHSYLIVLDNIETLEHMEALTSLLAALVGPSRIILTVRERLTAALPPTLPRYHFRLEELPPPASFQLLRYAAEQIHSPLLLHAPDEDLHKIYSITGGNPLALWLVAGQSWQQGWEGFIHKVLTDCPPGSRGYTLYDYLYRRSWEQLSLPARETLFAMHRCEGGADPNLLRTLSGLDPAAFDAATNELAHRMLLHYDGLYHIHRLTYSFLRTGVAGWWN